LAPSDFHLFGLLKTDLGGKRFADDKEVKMEVWKWLTQHSKRLPCCSFDTPNKQWDKCINVGGGYVKK
jgi:hypothetical protein